MHKKPLVAVLLFGLLLVLPFGSADAKIDPGQKIADGDQPLPYIARALEKDAPSAPQPVTGPATSVQLGVSRSGATYCDGYWQGAAAATFGNWFYGAEFYAAYQDPEELGSCSGLSDLYTFDVTSVVWRMQTLVTDVYHIQPIIYEAAGDIACPVPGQILCAGPLYEVSLNGPAGYFLTLPLPDECCVFGPYFAGFWFDELLGPGIVNLIGDGGPGIACRTYNDYGFGWYDMVDLLGFDLNNILFSEGNAYDQNNCPGTPGICDWQSWYDGAIVSYFSAPNANLINDYFTRFTADFSCTLQEFSFMAYCAAHGASLPTYRVTVYGTNGPIFAGRQYPQFDVPWDPGDPNFIESFDLPDGSYNCYPNWTDVDVTDLAFGPGQDIFVAVGISDNTPDPVNDVIAVLGDDGAYAGRSGIWRGDVGFWLYNDEVYVTPRDFIMEAYICCEQVDPEEVACAAPGPDDWNTFAHDYQRTSSTSIEVGDPCQINPIWYADQPFAINFTQASVADDRVYISNDQQARVYDLATGVSGPTIAGLPYIFASNRGNITVDGGAAWVTGGTGQSISKWAPDFSGDSWVNGVGGDNPPMGAQVRFGTATYLAGLDIVIIGSENARLWAFNGADGTLFGGWATNPLILDANVLHGAAFDGTDLYVGTAAAALDLGSIYSIDAATGTINWNYNSGAGDGFPSGVSLDGPDLYAASSGLASTAGVRYKLDAATGAEIWSFGQQRSLYGAPAIGRNFVYVNLDGLDAGGVYAIDKGSGAPVHNFSAQGVGQVPAHVTITCDNYMFAGDRNGKWWLLDLIAFDDVWGIEVPFGSAVFGTAVSSNAAGTTNYAILTTQSGGIAPGTGGMIAAYEFGSGARPVIAQHVFEVQIGVEFGTGPGNPFSEPDVLSNDGCADLNFTAINVYDPAPDVAASQFRNVQSQYAAALANRSVDASYNTYFETGKVNKAQRRLFTPVNEESFAYDQKMAELRSAIKPASNRTSARMAAGSAIVRTSGVTVTNPLPAGSMSDVDWLYDGTNLERGVDVELMEFVSDDPDRLLFGHHPILQVTYAGGCFPAEAIIEWNTLDVTRLETMYNDGQLGDDTNPDDTDWDGSGSQDVYDAAFYLAGQIDNNAVPPIAQYFEGDMYGNETALMPLFLPDPFPGPDCSFQGDQDVLLGYKRENGCPGTPTEIRGEWLRTAFIDTNITRLGTFGEAIGTRIVATEIGSYDPAYGDFKLMHYEVTNRDNVDKGPIYAGSVYDWDVRPDYSTNIGFHSLAFNGYVIYDFLTPELGFGMFDPNLPTAAGGVDPTANRPQRINPYGEGDDVNIVGNYQGPWQGGRDTDPWEELYEYTVSRVPQYETGPSDPSSSQGNPFPHQDWGALLTLKGQNLPANGTVEFNQCVFAVDATSGDDNTIEANALALATKASKWAGFARGDVNDDNTVNLLDVCWLLSGNQIYPDTYCGDVDLSGTVDAADEAYLLDFVTGLGPAPLGEWRFTF